MKNASPQQDNGLGAYIPPTYNPQQDTPEGHLQQTAQSVGNGPIAPDFIAPPPTPKQPVQYNIPLMAQFVNNFNEGAEGGILDSLGTRAYRTIFDKMLIMIPCVLLMDI